MAAEETTKYIIGIDEVGRGPIAGPVAVCAFMIKDDSILEGQKEKKLPKLKDSKKLSKKQREEWFEYLKNQKEEGKCDYAVSFVSSENIDKFGINKCIQKALNQSLEKVTLPEIFFDKTTAQDVQNSSRFTPEGMKHELLHVSSVSKGNHLYERQRIDDKGNYTDKNFEHLALFHLFLDGGLHAPAEYVKQETVIRGDELHPVISMASIMAKVTRDRVMTNYAKEYPEYGFENHSGYGTKAHYDAVKTHGQTPIHRKTYIH